MARTKKPLHELQMASPCSANWDEMKGTERVRRCRNCWLNVYRVCDLTREEAEEVVAAHEGHACRSLYRRQDGTVLVADCPKGVAAVRKASRWWKERVIHLLLLVLPWFILTGFIWLDAQTNPGDSYNQSIWDIEPFRTLDRLTSSSPTPGGVATPATAVPVRGGGPGMIWVPGDPEPDDPEVLPPRPNLPGRIDQPLPPPPDGGR
jgi:hypothetical protein